jgi:pyruvate-ferredoxin/flavodoxin oxidoreductase
MAMSYRNAYVASVAFGASDNQTVKAMLEAESYPGPSLVVAYSHCIAHGYDLRHGLDQQKLAVDSGVWPLYRYDPRLAAQGLPPLQMDSPPTHKLVQDYLRNESRFAGAADLSSGQSGSLSAASTHGTAQRLALYKELAHIALPS